MKNLSKLVAAAAAVLAVGAAQADTVIDLFNGNQGAPVADNDGSTGNVNWAAQYGPDANVQGLYRDLGVQKTNNFDDFDGVNCTTPGGCSGTRARVSNGTFNWSVDSGASGMAVVRWDGIDDANTVNAGGPSTLAPAGGISNHFLTTGLGLGMGLSLGVGDMFVFDVLVSDLNFTFWLELYDTSGNYSKFKFESQAHFASQSTPIPVAAFMGLCAGPSEFADPGDGDNDDVLAGVCSSSAFDFSNIGAMQIILESSIVNGQPASVDLRVSAVNVVPEPAILALVGAGLLGAAGAARRRRRA